jgi:hypothetical protein
MSNEILDWNFFFLKIDWITVQPWVLHAVSDTKGIWASFIAPCFSWDAFRSTYLWYSKNLIIEISSVWLFLLIYSGSLEFHFEDLCVHLYSLLIVLWFIMVKLRSSLFRDFAHHLLISYIGTISYVSNIFFAF